MGQPLASRRLCFSSASIKPITGGLLITPPPPPKSRAQCGGLPHEIYPIASLYRVTVVQVQEKAVQCQCPGKNFLCIFKHQMVHNIDRKWSKVLDYKSTKYTATKYSIISKKRTFLIFIYLFLFSFIIFYILLFLWAVIAVIAHSTLWKFWNDSMASIVALGWSPHLKIIFQLV